MLVNIFLIPAKAIAPEGSTMLRFSSNVSLIAAQISSVFTVTISGSTIGPELSDLRKRIISNGKAPICATAVPSANRPTCGKITFICF